MNFIGIDPGVSGAIVLLDHRLKVLDAIDMPTIQRVTSTKRKTSSLNGVVVASILEDWNPMHAFVEVATGLVPPPKDKRKWCLSCNRPKQMPGLGSTFNFGESYGRIKGILEGLGIAYHELTPVKWKRQAGLLKTDKERSRTDAISRWPEAETLLKLKKHHNRADAMWIAWAGYAIHSDLQIWSINRAEDQRTRSDDRPELQQPF